MQLVADLHLHSKYSRAVSQQMVIQEMAKWAKLKGIDLLGTGDFTHPLWLSELKANLEEREGILELKGQKDKGDQKDKGVRFLLTAEISSIYSQGGKTRKIHNLIIAPTFAVADKINTELKRRGCNLSSDGRPIVGLSAKNILELVLGVDDACLVIPCHIWTPHFSLFGSESGFDSIEECFGDLKKYIYAVETGLSSDPQMNWSVPQLDNINIVSFSDAHSGAKLGREATVLEIPDTKILRYEDIKGALIGKCEVRGGKLDNEVRSETSKDQDIPPQNPASHFNPHISYTIEFYPEEGKYHYTGHRNCGVVFSPEETKKKGTTCPVCGKRLTVGVMERVEKLGVRDRVRVKGEIDETGTRWIRGKIEGPERSREKVPFVKLVPLQEIIGESLGVGESAASVIREYQNLIEKLGDEIEILMRSRPEEIARLGGEKLAEGVKKVRSGDIFIKPGYDGEYGKVAVWGERDKRDQEDQREQMGLF